MNDEVRVDIYDQIVEITIDRPPANAINPGVSDSIYEALTMLQNDDDLLPLADDARGRLALHLRAPYAIERRWDDRPRRARSGRIMPMRGPVGFARSGALAAAGNFGIGRALNEMILFLQEVGSLDRNLSFRG